MVEHSEGQGLNDLELRTLLMTGQAVSQEQDPESICRWVADACSLLLGSSVAAIALPFQNPKSARSLYGKLGASPISGELAADLFELTEVEWPILQDPRGTSAFDSAELPIGLTSEGINYLARIRVGTIYRDIGILMVGMHGFWDPGPRGEFILNTLANQAAVALDNARIRREAIEQAETLRALIHASPLAIIAYDRDAKVQMWNPTAEELLGWSEQEMLGHPCTLVLQNQEDDLEENFQRASQLGSLVDLETRLQNKDGDWVDVGIWTTPLGDGDTMVIIADIAERKQAEEALREVAVLAERNRLAREIHDTLAQSLTGIIWQLNTVEGTIQSGGEPASEAIRRVRDLTRECLQEARRSVWNLQSPDA
ncbi:MAG: PAS domain S-box protein, partial [Dehalococcoidia bacterium]